MPKKGMIIGLLVLAVVVLIAFRGCSGIIPGTGSGSSGGTVPQTSAQYGDLGDMYVASQIDQNGCAAREETRFAPGDTIYVGTDPSDINQGTAVFARLLRDGQPVEDTREIVADNAIRGTCVWFEFQGASGSGGLEPGSYAAELMVNGSRVDRVQFVVGEDGSGSQGSAPSNLDLGQFVATSRVDSHGCPTSRVDEYQPDDTIVVALDESAIPQGTEIYARLVYEGDAIEDTQPIQADRDMQSCVWFQFDSDARGGFEPGRYTAQMMVNGSRADTVDFIVR